jgi:hypothetical protein
VRLYVEHDAATLAQLAGQAPPHCDGLIVRHRQLDDVLAATIRNNPLNGQWLWDVDLPSSRVLTWSGTLGREIFEANPLTWMRSGRDVFSVFCDEIAPQLAKHHRTLCFQPHSRHVLSDVQSCFSFLREQEGKPFEIALSPATMLEPSMLRGRDLEDHLERMFSTLGQRCAMVMLSDIQVVSENDEEHCKLVPLGDGVLPIKSILHLLRTHVPPQTPIVLSPAKLEQQLGVFEA